ncbi:MAG: crossover junction endodeoxyribonuclease RuvC [bacterium]|nr:crossover junction endodeoxyribonuclease RuvC [bacterium]
MRVFGIDPGVARVGYGVVEKKNNTYHLIDAGLISTNVGVPLAQRLYLIHEEARRLLKKHRPDIVAIEKLFFSNNAKTAFSVGQAWGVLSFTAASLKLPTVEFTPLQIKQAVTGYGQAPKSQVEQMLKKLLKADKFPGPDDVADAIACAYCAASQPPIYHG